jgi:hypothetical protein
MRLSRIVIKSHTIQAISPKPFTETMETTMRTALSASLLAAGLLATVFGAITFGGSPAYAQSATSYRYCLLTDEAQVCSYNSMEQCMASRRGNADFCEPNNVYDGNAPRSHR